MAWTTSNDQTDECMFLELFRKRGKGEMRLREKGQEADGGGDVRGRGDVLKGLVNY